MTDFSSITIKEDTQRGLKTYTVLEGKKELFSGGASKLKDFQINLMFDFMRETSNRLTTIEEKIALLEQSTVIVEPLD